MQWFTVLTVALAAFSSSLAAPTDLVPLPPLLQLPRISVPVAVPPARIQTTNLDLNNLDEHARAQARSILDEVVSRYPTLIDSFASLLDTQSLLSSASPLQNLRTPDLSLPSPLLPLPQLPKINDIVPSLPAMPSLPSLPGLPGLPGTGTPSVDANSALSSAVDVVLSNLRGFASAPLQIAPLRLTPPGGTPIVYTPAATTTGGLQLPKVMVPLVLTFPNEKGLPSDELAESIKKRIREQAETASDGSLNALVSLDPLALTHVLDVQPLPPTKENVKEGSSQPVRRIVSGPFLGNTEVQIYWDDPDSKTKPASEKQTDNVRIGMSDIESNLVPVTYPRVVR